MSQIKESSQSDIRAAVERLEDLIHGLGQPLLSARFNVELLLQASDCPGSGGAKMKIDHINQSIIEATSESTQISKEIRKLKEKHYFCHIHRLMIL